MLQKMKNIYQTVRKAQKFNKKIVPGLGQELQKKVAGVN